MTAAQERQQLKERERAIAAAEQARRKSVRVTFDLLGRQVSPMPTRALRQRVASTSCSLELGVPVALQGGGHLH